MLEPDCFLRCRMRCNTELYYVGKIPRTRIGRPLLQLHPCEYVPVALEDAFQISEIYLFVLVALIDPLCLVSRICRREHAGRVGLS